jgi:NAD(P)-dependent dehydrogenase (short-subunit alcohol dehydrogenase family)
VTSELSEKRALVTGGAQGLGRAIAELFVSRGAVVFLADLQADKAAEVAEEIGAAGAVACDVSNEASVAESVATAAEAMGGLDTMINNAGVEVVGPLLTADERDLDRLFAINVKGTWLGIKHSAPVIAANGGGAIVNLASIAGGVNSAPLFGFYAATKSAVVQLTRSAAIELRAMGVRVNAVCPGMFNTEMLSRIAPAFEELVGASFDEVLTLKQGRAGEPREVAEMVAFLASDEAGFTNGAHYVIDNGMTAGLI